MSARSSVPVIARPHPRVTRAHFSPLRHALPRPRVASRADAAPAGDAAARRSARAFAERAFVSRWLQPGFLDRAQPAVTRFHE